MLSPVFSQARLAPDEPELVAWVAERYDRCHPTDSFDDLGRRASFSREDRRLMEDWLEAGHRALSSDDCVGGSSVFPAAAARRHRPPGAQR